MLSVGCRKLARVPDTESASSSLFQEWASVCIIFASTVLTALLLVLLVFKLASGTPLPSIRLEGYGAQFVVWTIHSPGRISEPLGPPSSSVSPPRDADSDLIVSFSSYPLPCRSFLIALVVEEFFCQSPSSLISARTAPRVDVYFGVSTEGSELSIFLFCRLDILLPQGSSLMTTIQIRKLGIMEMKLAVRRNAQPGIPIIQLLLKQECLLKQFRTPGILSEEINSD